MSTNHISPATHLIIKGARQHNLKDVDLTLPKNKLVVFTGLSGSGKSSLAFDTIYAEGQRRYVESLSSYARQFLGIMQKPDVDQIEGLSPAISIDQKTTSHNPRSTVGTITEIYDYLRLLYARIGHPHCPNCGSEIAPQSIDQIVAVAAERIIDSTKTAPVSRWLILSPVVRDKKGEFSGLLDNLKKKGFDRIRVDGRMYRLDEDFLLIKTNRHSIECVIERVSFDKKQSRSKGDVAVLKKRLFAAVEQSLDLSQGLVMISQVNDASLDFPDKPANFTDHLFSQKLACPTCNTSFAELEPRLFSFNTPHGACPTCTGLGTLLKIDPTRIVAPDLTLSEGAIIPLANALSTDSWYSRKMKAIVESHNADYRAPYRDLPEPVKHTILYGDSRFYRVSGTNRDGREATFTFKPEGIVRELERRYQETQSDFIRLEIGRFMRTETCPACHGARLKPEALSVTIDQLHIKAVTDMFIHDLKSWVDGLLAATAAPTDPRLSASEKLIARAIIKEIAVRVDFLVAVGLDYLTLSREAQTLAGGEAQRIRLASQIGTGLTGVLYVLDEPTIGLHPRDNDRLIATLTKLRDLGNTIVVVEHDKSVMQAADYLVDFGPGAGARGGMIVSQGTVTEITTDDRSLTGQYLSGKRAISNGVLAKAAKQLPLGLLTNPVYSSKNLSGSRIRLTGARYHNLKSIDLEFPLNQFTVITGVSGSGKSTVMHDTLYPALKQALNLKVDSVGDFDRIDGYQDITKVLMIDQSPIGRTPRSNPATYTKAFDHIRQIFAQSRDAKALGFKPGRFSFNMKGGRCEACQGGGEVKISMQFLSDVYVTCDVCHGKRYNSETLSVQYHGNSIADILDLTIDQAIGVFKNHPPLLKKLATLQAVGLGYIKLGQPAPTLSGGEAQRVKLAKELSVGMSGHTVYLLDEPTTGLHFEDVKNLLIVLKTLVGQNNTVIVIEHNLDVIKNADWVVDLGPDGGDRGGEVVAAGTPADIAAVAHSHTGQYLRQELVNS